MRFREREPRRAAARAPARTYPFEQGGTAGCREETEPDLRHHPEARESPDAREDERKTDLQDGDDGARGAERARDAEPCEERARGHETAVLSSSGRTRGDRRRSKPSAAVPGIQAPLGVASPGQEGLPGIHARRREPVPGDAE